MELFGVGLKLIAVQDPGNRDELLWEAFNLDVTEDARRVAEVVDAAVADRPGFQLITDQGRPFCAVEAEKRYEEAQVEHAPIREGTPTRNATLERSFGLIKPVVATIATLTAQIATACPILRNGTLASVVGKYLISALLEAYRLGRSSSLESPRTIDRELWERRAAEIREAAVEQNDSRRLLLERIHEEYRMPGSKESFVRAYRYHSPEDIIEAERRFRNRDCWCAIEKPNFYFGGILRNVREERRGRRRQQEQQLRERKERDRQEDQFRQEQAAFDANPRARLACGLEQLGMQWWPRTSQLLAGGHGRGWSNIRQALTAIREREGSTPAIAAADVAWKTWLTTATTIDEKGRAQVHQAYLQIIGEAAVNNLDGFTPATFQTILKKQPPPNTPRSPPVPLRN
ncbi:MAG: hypothetical protein AB1793_09550 [Candidatus Thermoplasmatota archaeon]